MDRPSFSPAEMPEGHGVRTKVIVLGILALLMLLIGAGVFAFSRRSKNQQPAVVAESMVRLAEAGSYRTEAELTFHLPDTLDGSPRPLRDIIANVEGAVVRNEGGVREFTGTFTTTAAGRGTTFVADGDLRITDEDTFFYLREFPALLNPTGNLVDAWTQVRTALLRVQNGADVQQALATAAEQLHYAGEEETDAGRLTYFTGTLLSETKDELAAVLQQSASGSPALDVAARLLAANDVQRVGVWVQPKTKQPARIEIDFTRTLSDGSTFSFASLALAFSDYGVSASVEKPEAALSVRPEVFRQLFGGEELTEVQVTESE